MALLSSIEELNNFNLLNIIILQVVFRTELSSFHSNNFSCLESLIRLVKPRTWFRKILQNCKVFGDIFHSKSVYVVVLKIS